MGRHTWEELIKILIYCDVIQGSAIFSTNCYGRTGEPHATRPLCLKINSKWIKLIRKT